MPAKPKSQHASLSPSARASAAARRSGRVPREHLPDDSPLLHGLGGRRVMSLGRFVVDGGAPAQALAQAVGDLLDSLPARVLRAIGAGDATVLYEHGASAGDYNNDWSECQSPHTHIPPRRRRSQPTGGQRQRQGPAHPAQLSLAPAAPGRSRSRRRSRGRGQPARLLQASKQEAQGEPSRPCPATSNRPPSSQSPSCKVRLAACLPHQPISLPSSSARHPTRPTCNHPRASRLRAQTTPTRARST